MKYWIVFFGLLFTISSHASDCPSSVKTALDSERQILQASLLDTPQGGISQQLEQPLRCLLKIFKTSKGMLKQVAHTSLTAIYGRTRNEAYSFDPRYKMIARILIRESLKDEMVREFILGGYADGMTYAYKMFCGESDRSHCVDMLPTNPLIAAQKDLISAGNMYLLKNVYETVDDRQKNLIRNRILDLHRQLKSDPASEDS